MSADPFGYFRRVAAVTCAWLLILGAPSASAEDVVVASDRGHFTIAFPVEPEIERSEMAGKVFETYNATTPSGRFKLVWDDMTVGPRDYDETFRELQETIVGAYFFKEGTVSDVTVRWGDGPPFRARHIKGKSSVFNCHVMIILDQERSYTISHCVDPEDDPEPGFEKFFDSLRLSGVP